MIDIDEEFRDGLAEITRTKPALGPINLHAVRVAAARKSAVRRRTMPRWVAVAAAVVVIAGLGLWFGTGLGFGPRVTDAQPVAPTADALIGTTWTLSIINRKPVVDPSTAAPPKLVFVDLERIGGDDGCNSISSSYRLYDDRLTLTGVGATQVACDQSEEATVQQAAYIATLLTVVRLRIDGSTLILFDSAGAPVLIFDGDPDAVSGPSSVRTPMPTPSSKAPSGVRIRLRNDAATTLGDINVNFGTGDEARYGNLAPGQSSDYLLVGRAYGYAAVRTVVAGEQVVLQPADYVGEPLLEPGRYTYAITYRHDQLGLTLETD